MRNLSDTTRDLIRRLQNFWWPASRPPRPNDEQIAAAALAEIGEAREPDAVPELVPFLFHGRPDVSAAAAQAIDRITGACDPLALARLDGAVREQSDWGGRFSARPQDVPALSRGLVGPLGVLSFNASGFVREAAVGALAAVRDGTELPFLLIRLNDWAKPVRDAARRAVAERIVPDYAAHLVRCLPLVERLRGQGRDDHGALVDSVTALLRSPGSRAALRDALRRADRPTRRLAFRLLADGTDEEALPVLEDASSLPDTVLRLWAARGLRTRLRGDALAATLRHLRHDRFMPVRREALSGFAEHLPDAAPAEFRAALLDPHPSVREFARFHLRQQPGVDFPAFYRDGLDAGTPADLRVSIAGLGETGAAPDAARLAAFLTHADARVRRAAVRAVARLDAESFIEPLFAAIQDPAAGVVAEAAAAVRPRLFLVPPSRLAALLRSDAPPHVQRALVRLAAELPPWDAAPLLLFATGFDDPAARDFALASLRHWSRRWSMLSVRPRPDQLRQIDDAFARHGGALDPGVHKDIHSLLAYARQHLG